MRRQPAAPAPAALPAPFAGQPFDAHAIVTQGEMWLIAGEPTDRLLRGDGYDLPFGSLHWRGDGAEGATTGERG